MGAGQSLVNRSRRSFSALKDFRRERDVVVRILSACCARVGQLSPVAQKNAQVGCVARMMLARGKGGEYRHDRCRAGFSGGSISAAAINFANKAGWPADVFILG